MKQGKEQLSSLLRVNVIITVAEEDERLGRCGDGQPAAGEELHAPRVPHVLLLVRRPIMAFRDQGRRRRRRRCAPNGDQQGRNEGPAENQPTTSRPPQCAEPTPLTLTSWYSTSMSSTPRPPRPVEACVTRGEEIEKNCRCCW